MDCEFRISEGVRCVSTRIRVDTMIRMQDRFRTRTSVPRCRRQELTLIVMCYQHPSPPTTLHSIPQPLRSDSEPSNFVKLLERVMKYVLRRDAEER